MTYRRGSSTDSLVEPWRTSMTCKVKHLHHSCITLSAGPCKYHQTTYKQDYISTFDKSDTTAFGFLDPPCQAFVLQLHTTPETPQHPHTYQPVSSSTLNLSAFARQPSSLRLMLIDLFTPNARINNSSCLGNPHQSLFLRNTRRLSTAPITWSTVDLDLFDAISQFP
jgi:hypothetical protein